MADLKALRARFEELKGAMEVGLFGTISSEDVDAVLELIREAELRVMTLDEVLNADDFVWAEIYTPSKWSWCVIYVKISPVVSNDEIVKIEEDCGTGWTKNKSEYGKRGFLDGGWRCWTARPLPEQRNEVKWDEDAGV